MRLATLALVLSVLLGACSGSDSTTDAAPLSEGQVQKDCMTICKEAQAANCSITSPSSNCDELCRGLKTFADKAGCQSRWNAYDLCAKSNATCEIVAKCASQIGALTICVFDWCSQNIDPDCKGQPKKDCVTICKEAQAANCSSIKDCDKHCRVTKSVADKAGCQSQLNAYSLCASSHETCEIDTKCALQLRLLTNCAGAWCLQNKADSDCKELLTF